MIAWLDSLPEGQWWALMTLFWVLACFAVAGLARLGSRHREFDHTHMVDRAREQARRELRRDV